MYKWIVRTGIITLLVLSSFIFSYAYSIDCRVTEISDGDTFRCIPSAPVAGAKVHSDGSISVRLRGADAPEKAQQYGPEARESLKNMIDGKNVKLDIRDIDRYGRVPAYVYLGNLNVNLEQVKRGFAWAYKEYLDRPYASEFYDAEEYARKQKLGLWKQLNPIPPWEWRKQHKH